MYAQTERGKKAEEYLIRYPKLPTMTLARLLYSENDGMYKDAMHAREILRSYRGEKNRKRDFGSRGGKQGQYALVSDSIADSWEKYVLPKSANNILVINDLHIPYHSVDAVTAAIEWGKEHNVNCIVLNGDIVDFYQISRFIRSPQNPSIKNELNVLEDFLLNLRDMFPNAKIVYKEGNHEKRLENFMRTHAAELYDVVDYKLPDLLNFVSLKIDYVDNERIIMAGNVNIIHGHEVPGNRQANVSRQIFQRTNENTIVGHSHIADKHVTTTVNDSIRGCWAVPCLCDLHPEYARINRWTHGFLRLHIVGEDKFKVFQGEIHNGQVL